MPFDLFLLRNLMSLCDIIIYYPFVLHVHANLALKDKDALLELKAAGL